MNAVECAVAIQRVMAQRNADTEEAHRMRLRIGINQGDVVFVTTRVVGAIAPTIAAASCALAGRNEEAKRLMARLLEVDPALRISKLQNVLGPYRQPEHLAKYAEGLRKAGLPE